MRPSGRVSANWRPSYRRLDREIAAVDFECTGVQATVQPGTGAALLPDHFPRLLAILQPDEAGMRVRAT
jgi:hypothetical protein